MNKFDINQSTFVIRTDDDNLTKPVCCDVLENKTKIDILQSKQLALLQQKIVLIKNMISQTDNETQEELQQIRKQLHDAKEKRQELQAKYDQRESSISKVKQFMEKKKKDYTKKIESNNQTSSKIYLQNKLLQKGNGALHEILKKSLDDNRALVHQSKEIRSTFQKHRQCLSIEKKQGDILRSCLKRYQRQTVFLESQMPPQSYYSKRVLIRFEYQKGLQRCLALVQNECINDDTNLVKDIEDIILQVEKVTSSRCTYDDISDVDLFKTNKLANLHSPSLVITSRAA